MESILVMLFSFLEYLVNLFRSSSSSFLPPQQTTSTTLNQVKQLIRRTIKKM